MKDASAYKDANLSVSKAATTRDGATWVYVTDVTSNKLTGWVKASALKEATDVPASEGVTINYTNKVTG
ncbi:GW dipeptide domain-containing protein [Levilactobacillus brevis]|uniref:GW dipeptide domain-containing protein n=1 Tax=Levilactobacillus brevis TaxID=1580 RepID=UPI003D1646E5